MPQSSNAASRFFVAFAAAVLLCGGAAGTPLPATGTIEPIFTPDGDAEGAILQALQRARRSVRVQAFLLSNRKLANGLLDAKRRGIEVEVLADREMTQKDEHSLIPRLVENRIPVWIEVRYAIAHNKIIIIDGETPASATAAVITGSFNFTRAAQVRNAENLLILRGNPSLVKAYLDNWQRHRADAVPYGDANAERDGSER